MKLERSLPGDLNLAWVVDHFDAPAMLVSHLTEILQCNDSMHTLTGAASNFSLNALLKPSWKAAFKNWQSDVQNGREGTCRLEMLIPTHELILSPMQRAGNAPMTFLGLAVAKIEPSDMSNASTVAALEERWQIAIETTGQGLWDHDFETGKSHCSASWYQIRGLEPVLSARVSTQSWLRKIHPDDQNNIKEKTEAISAGKIDTIDYEYRERHAEGHWTWILARGRVVKRSPESRVLRIIGCDTDVTKLKERAEEFGSLSKSLDLAVSVAGIGVWEFDLKTSETKWDREMYAMYGIDPFTPRNRDNIWQRHIHDDDRDKATRLSEHCLRTGEDFSLDYRIIRQDGAIRHIRSKASFHEDSTGRRKLIGVNWDVTSDYEFSERLKEANRLAQSQNAALEAARAAMEFSALHDALTGLANRRKLDEFLQACPDDASPAVLHIDLDRFKQINDTLGHAAGDQVLIHAANILSSEAPDDALVARVGGDEFVVFITHAPSNDVLEELANRIIDTSLTPYIFEESECRFGMSVGIATVASSSSTGSALFANADLALYLAKNEGRGRCRFYTADLKVAAQVKKQCADEILAGLEKGEFFCVYQPQFDAKTLDLSGVEALVRWRHPSGEVWAPSQFLPTADELDVVNQIDRIVLLQAVQDTQMWHQNGLHVPRMSVNVSARRLTDPLLAGDLEILDQMPGKFTFELLESVFLDTQNDQLAANLERIRDRGIDIEIDDFGTGHASIVGLLNLKPTRLKIDRQLIQPVVTSEQQRSLVQAIVQIGKLQGIAVVAEGVETAAHIDVLQSLGCDFLQGFGLASPTPADQIGSLLTIAQCNGKYRPFGVAKSA